MAGGKGSRPKTMVKRYTTPLFEKCPLCNRKMVTYGDTFDEPSTFEEHLIWCPMIPMMHQMTFGFDQVNQSYIKLCWQSFKDGWNGTKQ